MSFFETIPTIKEARQYEGTMSSFADLTYWSNGAVFDDFSAPLGKSSVKVRTIEGTSYEVPKGYWIIKGVNGEFYPCEDSIFQKSYRKVDRAT